MRTGYTVDMLQIYRLKKSKKTRVVRPSTDQLHHLVTHDMGHVTHDMLHMNCDLQHTGVGELFSQNFKSLALTVWELWCFEYGEEKDLRVS